MKKDIYIIKNRINNKVYVGQALDPTMRFKQHCKPSSAKDGSLIAQAIQKYGKENFWFEILESQIENYNEREIYWIDYYQCTVPFGYNIQSGGDVPPIHFGLDHPGSSVHNKECLQAIKWDLINTDLSLSQIGAKHGVSKRTVLRINQGVHYSEINETYPLRKEPNRNGKLTEEQIESIIEILKYSYRMYPDIAKQFEVSDSLIKQINSGVSHHKSDESYPIRKYIARQPSPVTYEQVTNIIDSLQNSNISFRQLALNYNVNITIIQGINNGSNKRYYRENISYPIRKYD